MSFWDFLSSIIKMLSALALVLGMMVFAVYGMKKFMNKTGPVGNNGEHIKILSTKYLGPKGSIMLLDVLGQVIVVGVTASSISLLTGITDEKSLEKLQHLRDGRQTMPAFMDHLTLYKRKLKTMSIIGHDR
jgi:flagellar protein FliO/FliZ